MSNDSWRPRLHLAPYRGLSSDPNGICQFKGTYHVFCQDAPAYPGNSDGPHGWGHFASRDLVSWVFLGCHVMPDVASDRDGAYSGGAFVSDETDELWLYYTGNVRDGVGDGTTSGRLANQTRMKSYNGIHLGPKEVVLDNSGYPAYCSCHVRDPKVWSQDGMMHMMLGARTLADSRGFVMMYDSADGERWEMAGSATNRAEAPFGYMWECPDRIVLAGREFLSVCPQGMAVASDPDDPMRFSCQNVHAAGYFPIEGTIVDLMHTDEGRIAASAPRPAIDEGTFCDWDYGFDYYACQSFVDEKGRTLLVGWIGLSRDRDDVSVYGNPTSTWEGALSIPRELTLSDDGLILQNPVAEFDALRGEPVSWEHEVTLAEKCADVVLEGIDGDGSVMLGDFLELSFEGGLAVLEFLDDEVGQGRIARRAIVGDVCDLRIIVDTSIIEIYVNGGETVFSTRYYDEGETLTVATDLYADRSVWYPMDDVTVNYLVER